MKLESILQLQKSSEVRKLCEYESDSENKKDGHKGIPLFCILHQQTPNVYTYILLLSYLTENLY